jgi:hypothetical protein
MLYKNTYKERRIRKNKNNGTYCHFKKRLEIDAKNFV